MKIHKNLIKLSSDSVLPYIIGTDAILFAACRAKSYGLQTLALFTKIFVMGVGMPFLRNNNIEDHERTIELKIPREKIDIEFPNNTQYSVLISKVSDIVQLKPFFDAFQKGDEKILSISHSKLESTTFYSPSNVRNSFLDYALLATDAVVSYSFFEILEDLPQLSLLVPNILAMLTMKGLDNLVLFSKPRVEYFTLKYSDEANSEGFYDCYLLDQHGEMVETATSILV